MASSTLNLAGLSKLKLDQDLIESGFDRISRYYIAARLINDLAPKGKLKVLDVGGLGTILPRLIKHQMTVLDVDPNPDPDYVQGDATKQPFKDGQFDVVVTCDTLEHIPKDKRDDFIKECVRVAKNLVIIAAPFDRGQAAQSEKDLNAFYKSLSGHEHRWLKEHIEIGLPTEQNTEKVLNSLPVGWVKVGHTNIEIWRALVEANFISECIEIDPLRAAIGKLNEYYNTELLDDDFGKETYRLFYVISKTGKISLKLPKSGTANSVQLALLRKAHETYAQNINLLGHKTLTQQAEIYQRLAELKRARKDIKNLQAGLDAIYNSKGWHMLSKVYTAKQKTNTAVKRLKKDKE